MDVYLVIYTTTDKTVYRLVQNRNYFLGRINSYGWYIVDFQILYQERFITINSYKKILEEYNRKRICWLKRKQKVLRILQVLHDTFK